MATKKILAVFPLVILAAATALAYGQSDVAAAVATQTQGTAEPVALLLSGSVLLSIATALRRLPL